MSEEQKSFEHAKPGTPQEVASRLAVKKRKKRRRAREEAEE